MDVKQINVGDWLFWKVNTQYRRKGQGPLIRKVKVLGLRPKSVKVLADNGIFYPHWTELSANFGGEAVAGRR